MSTQGLQKKNCLTQETQEGEFSFLQTSLKNSRTFENVENVFFTKGCTFFEDLTGLTERSKPIWVEWNDLWQLCLVNLLKQQRKSKNNASASSLLCHTQSEIFRIFLKCILTRNSKVGQAQNGCKISQCEFFKSSLTFHTFAGWKIDEIFSDALAA